MSRLEVPVFTTPSGEASVIDAPLSTMRPERVKMLWNEISYQLSKRVGFKTAIVMDFADDRLKVLWEPASTAPARPAVEFS